MWKYILGNVVPDVRVELTTRGSSGHCSTDELIRHIGLLNYALIIDGFMVLGLLA